MVAPDGESPASDRTGAARNATQGANAAAKPGKVERSTGLAQLARGFVSRSGGQTTEEGNGVTSAER